MEKNFFITMDNADAQEYICWQTAEKRINQSYSRFAKEHGIVSTEYFATSTAVFIAPTLKDLDLFGPQLCSKHYPQGLRKFRNNSPMAIAWSEQFKKDCLQCLPKPHICQIIGIHGGGETFNSSDCLYIQVSNMDEQHLPQGWNSISKETYDMELKKYSKSCLATRA